MTSGNAIVDAVSRINFSGDITPRIWRKTITKKNGKPYPLARDLLSDFVYFYRAIEETDPMTGAVTMKKRFEYDLLYKTYSQMQEEYGESASTLRRAINRLEEIGVIKKHLRTIEKNGMRFNNVLFIELVPSVLVSLTYPEDKPKTNNISEMLSENPDKVKDENEEVRADGERSDEAETFPAEDGMIKDETENSIETVEKALKDGGTIPPPIKNDRRVLSKMTGHTENTTRNNNIYNIHPSISNSIQDNPYRQTGREEVLEPYPLDAIRELFGLDGSDVTETEDVTSEDIDNLLYVVYDAMNTSKQTISIAGEKKPVPMVISKLSKLNREHLIYAIRQFKSQHGRIRNQAAYLLTILYRSQEQMALDKLNQKSMETKAPPVAEAENIPVRPVRKNQFQKFPQRDYTSQQYESLEKQLLRQNKLIQGGKDNESGRH